MRRQIVLVTVLVVVAFQATVPGQTPSKEVAPRQIVSPRLPDTPAGRQLAGWLQAFNSGDAETLRKYLSANLSSDAVRATSVADRVERNLFVYEDTGGLIISDVVTSSPQQIAVIARMKKKERRVRVMLEVTDSNPRAIASIGIRLLPSRPSSNARQGKLSESEIASGLADFLNKEAAADRFSGAALVAKNGQPILERAYGLADRPAHRPNRLDTRFNLGSMNKMFTGVAIMQLVEQGKLSLQDTIDKCLPDYPDKEIARQVTVHQLLTHTSGLGDFFNEKFRTASHRPEKLADFVPYFAGQPLGFPPGTKFRYSNAGYIVLGLIVEKISGTNYYDYVKQHIYEPAGMVNTAHRYPPSEKTTVAVGYTHAEALAQERSSGTARSEPSKCQFQARRSRAARAGQLGRRRILNGA